MSMMLQVIKDWKMGRAVRKSRERRRDRQDREFIFGWDKNKNDGYSQYCNNTTTPNWREIRKTQKVEYHTYPGMKITDTPPTIHFNIDK